MLKKLFAAVVLFSAFFCGCKKDSRNPPNITLKGKLAYQGKPLGFKAAEVFVDLYQPGYAIATSAIPCRVDQEGNYSALLFSGDYKAILRRGIAPLNNNTLDNTTDSIPLKITGNMNKDFEVVPYYYVNEPQYTYQQADSTISAVVKIDKVVANKTLENIGLYISASQYCDYVYSASGKLEVGASSVADLNSITLKAKVARGTVQQGYFFVRVGAKTLGLNARNYSLVKKIELK